MFRMMAREGWGLAPWEIEADAPALWVDRWLAAHNLESKPRKPRPAGKGHGRRL